MTVTTKSRTKPSTKAPDAPEKPKTRVRLSHEPSIDAELLKLKRRGKELTFNINALLTRLG